jgi:chromosome segregation ATPase
MITNASHRPPPSDLLMANVLDSRDRARDERARLLAQVDRLKTSLQAALRENQELRRTLAAVQLENERLRATPQIAPARVDRVTRVRGMLRDRASRNP